MVINYSHQYFLKINIPFPFIEIEPKFKSQFLGYIQIFYDLQFVNKCLVYLSQIYNISELDFIKQTVWESFIIKYAKCFTKAEGRKVKLEAKDLFKNNSVQMEIHHELMELRHQHIAHGGNSKNEFIDSFLHYIQIKYVHLLEFIIKLNVHFVQE